MYSSLAATDFESPENLYLKHRCAEIADATGLKIEVFAISLLSIADQIVSVFPGKMRKIHNLAGSRAGTAERSPLLHKFLHNEFA